MSKREAIARWWHMRLCQILDLVAKGDRPCKDNAKLKGAELEAARVYMREQCERLQNVLREGEWWPLHDDEPDENLYCRACGAYKHDGHKQDCWLRQALEEK